MAAARDRSALDYDTILFYFKETTAPVAGDTWARLHLSKPSDVDLDQRALEQIKKGRSQANKDSHEIKIHQPGMGSRAPHVGTHEARPKRPKPARN